MTGRLDWRPFNEAAAVKPRKTLVVIERDRVDLRPSMRPRR